MFALSEGQRQTEDRARGSIKEYGGPLGISSEGETLTRSPMDPSSHLGRKIHGHDQRQLAR